MLHSGLFKETTLYVAVTVELALTLEALDYQPMYTYSRKQHYSSITVELALTLEALDSDY